MTLAFWNEYCDEAHTLFGQDWLYKPKAPSGFDQAQLMADLESHQIAAFEGHFRAQRVQSSSGSGIRPPPKVF